MLLVNLAVLCALILIAVIDWRRREIWHAITLPGIAFAIAAAQSLPARFTLNAATGALTAFVLFLMIWRAGNRAFGVGAFGFGDVMLAALIGAIGGVVYGLLWLALGMLGAGLYASYLKSRGETRFAYGTFLALAAAVGLLVALYRIQYSA